MVSDLRVHEIRYAAWWYSLITPPSTFGRWTGRSSGTSAHREFVREHYDLSVLGSLAAAQRHQPANDPGHDQAEQAKGHKPRSCRNQLIGPNTSSQRLRTSVPGTGAGRARHRVARRTCCLAPDRTLKQGPARRQAPASSGGTPAERPWPPGPQPVARARRGGPASQAAPGPIGRARHSRTRGGSPQGARNVVPDRSRRA